MNPYIAGLITLPLLAFTLWILGGILVRAWDAWEKLLTRLRPWKAPKERRGFITAIVALAPTVWVLRFPGVAIFIAHEGERPLTHSTMNVLGQKIDTLVAATVEKAAS